MIYHYYFKPPRPRPRVQVSNVDGPRLRLELPGTLARFDPPMEVLPKIFAVLRYLDSYANPTVEPKILQWLHDNGIVEDEVIDSVHFVHIDAALQRFIEFAEMSWELQRVRKLTPKNLVKYIDRSLA